MEVACWCGNRFAVDGDIGRCPRCHATTVLPQVTDRDREEMTAEITAITSGETSDRD